MPDHPAARPRPDGRGLSGSLPRPSLPDALVAAACALASIGYALVALHPGPVPHAVAVVQALLATALTFASLFWRVRPRGAGVVIALLLAGWAGSFWWALPVNTGLTPFLLLAALVVYAWTRWTTSRRWEVVAAALGIAGAFVSPAAAVPADHGMVYSPVSIAVQILALGFAWLLARHHRTRDEEAARRARDETDRQEALAREHAARAERAVQSERERIASEIHDILAHSLTLIHARSTAGLVASGVGPSPQREALVDVRESASRALAGVRDLVGTLSDESASPATPLGDLRDVPTVVTRFEGAGLRMQADISSAAALAEAQERLPVLVRLAIMRVLDEGLTNALRHGRIDEPVELALSVDDRVHVRVVNAISDRERTPATMGTGTGLMRLRSRVESLGGTLTVRGESHRFVLDASIPSTRPAPVAASAPHPQEEA